MQAPKQESNYDVVPAGNHVARVYRVLNIGTIPEIYMGENKMVNKVMIGFELLNERKVFKADKGEEPYVISREYTFSMAEKANLRKLVEGMLGVALRDDEAEAFDFSDIVGKECLLNVIHKKSGTGNIYALVQGASPIPKGMVVPEPYNKPQTLDYRGGWNEDAFLALPKFLQEKMKQSLEYKAKYANGEINPADIPF